jgi:hypothetical protein
MLGGYHGYPEPASRNRLGPNFQSYLCSRPGLLRQRLGHSLDRSSLVPLRHKDRTAAGIISSAASRMFRTIWQRGLLWRIHGSSLLVSNRLRGSNCKIISLERRFYLPICSEYEIYRHSSLRQGPLRQLFQTDVCDCAAARLCCFGFQPRHGLIQKRNLRRPMYYEAHSRNASDGVRRERARHPLLDYQKYSRTHMGIERLYTFVERRKGWVREMRGDELAFSASELELIEFLNIVVAYYY